MILCEYPDRCAQHKRLKMKCPYCDNSSLAYDFQELEEEE